MCLLISNLAVGNYNNERQIPEQITITFSNGEKVRYEPCNEIPCGQTQLAHFQRPKFDVAEEKTDDTTFEALEAHYTAQLRSLNETYKSQVTEAKNLYSQVKADIKDFFERRDAANDQLWSTLSRGMLVDYQSVKKSLDRKIQALNDPVERLKLMVQWLKDTKSFELLEAAKIFESETDYILKKLQTPAKKWDSFLSHVQKDASDLCRNIKDRLRKHGVATWWDKAADRIDNRGMTDGIIDSSVFILVLTKDYFKRRYCIYEYCLALVVQKPVIVISETDERYGGGSINSFKLEGIFKHVLSHEIIGVHRIYWNAFIEHLHSRIQTTLKSNSMSLVGFTVKDVVISDSLGTESTILKMKNELKTVVSDSLGLESTILKKDEMAFLENELNTVGAKQGRMLRSSRTEWQKLPRFSASKLNVFESKDGRVFGTFDFVTSIGWSGTINSEHWFFWFRPFKKVPFKKDRITIEGTNDLKIGSSMSVRRNSARYTTFRLKHFEIFELRT